MGGINQSLKEKILSVYPDSPETELAIQAIELAEKHKDDPDQIKQKLDILIKNLTKHTTQKGEKNDS